MAPYEDPRTMEQIRVSLVQLRIRVDMVLAEIGYGIPESNQRGGRETIRDRLHTVEVEGHAVKALSEALMASIKEHTKMLERLERDRKEQRAVQAAFDRRWSKWKTRLLFAFAGVAAVSPFVIAWIGPISDTLKDFFSK